MPTPITSGNTTKLYQFAFGLLLLFIGISATRSMMFGATSNFKVIVALVVAVVVVLALDKKYWLLCPVLIASGLAIPGLPFDGTELGCISFISVYFLRQASFRSDRTYIPRAVLPALPVFVWICVVWALNPTGMFIFGSESIGGRYYFKIAIGFITMLCFSTLQLREKDCRLLFRCVVLASVLAFIRDIAMPSFSSDADSVYSGASAESTSNYQLLGALSLYVILFARYSLSEILSSGMKLFTAAVLAAIVVYTGKRQGFGTLAVVPIVRMFVTGRDKLQTVFCAVLGLVVIFFVVMGDGSFYDLPRSTKRGLSVVVPKYAEETFAGTRDIFREEVHRLAGEIIRRDPWFGRRGFAMNANETRWIVSSGANRGVNYTGHAYSGNWHGTWHAFAADFGIPAAVFWALFMLCALIVDWKACRLMKYSSYSGYVVMFYLFNMYRTAIFSITSGHSALTPLSVWVTYSMILAIRNGCELEKRERAEPEIES